MLYWGSCDFDWGVALACCRVVSSPREGGEKRGQGRKEEKEKETLVSPRELRPREVR